MHTVSTLLHTPDQLQLCRKPFKCTLLFSCNEMHRHSYHEMHFQNFHVILLLIKGEPTIKPDIGESNTITQLLALSMTKNRRFRSRVIQNGVFQRNIEVKGVGTKQSIY